VAAGGQVYVVGPAVEESENDSGELSMADISIFGEELREFALEQYKNSQKPPLKAAVQYADELAQRLPDYSVAFVHGKMKAAEKDEQMQKFASGEAHILVSTTVIEVGVNVPNASVMIIESAERFGLSQLHQLRGRVGRGAEQSYCILITSVKLSKESRQRMDIMVQSNDGFEISEADLKMRGPGDLEGTQQSGIPFNLKIANLANDGQILQLARETALEILKEDPSLDGEKNFVLNRQLNQLAKGKINWGAIS
jgi:ATP-dependent DNA helicase RecG